MRILWIGKHPTDGAAGDEVFDRKTIAACRSRGHSVELFHPARVGRVREVLNLVSGVPHYRTRFASGMNRSAVRRMSSAYDITICSWEPFDALARGLVPPCILILHNVTSRSLPALFPNNMLATVGAARARIWERNAYRRPGFAALGALSRRDQGYLEGLKGHPDVVWLPPGMPPCVELDADAPLLPEIVLSGTFDWVPKRRDLLAFAQDFAALAGPIAIRAKNLPEEAMRQLRPLSPLSTEETRAALRFGLITDRFEAGHKLKTMAYIAANQIVLSMADIGEDFAQIPDCDLFLRRIEAASEIEAHIRTLSGMPTAALRDRFLTFKRRCAQAFTWEGVAKTLLDTAANITFRQRGQQQPCE